MTRALSDLSRLLDAEEELVRVLQRGVDQATWAIPSADLVSVTVVRDDRAETVAANDERVRAIDSQQYAVGEGPYLEAARSGETVRANVERATALWPRFARVARAGGVASFLSSPLIIAGGSWRRPAATRNSGMSLCSHNVNIHVTIIGGAGPLHSIPWPAIMTERAGPTARPPLTQAVRGTRS